MKYVFRSLLILIALLLPLYFAAHSISVKSETDDQQYAAFEQFRNWCHNPENNVSICIDWRENGESPWTARVYHINDDGSVTEWEEIGYPRLMWAVRAVEFDHMMYKNGHSRKF